MTLQFTPGMDESVISIAVHGQQPMYLAERSDILDDDTLKRVSIDRCRPARTHVMNTAARQKLHTFKGTASGVESECMS